MRPRFLICSILFAAGLAVAAPKAGSIVTVRVLTAKVMKNPKFIGPPPEMCPAVHS